jgi:hypothetical protein
MADFGSLASNLGLSLLLAAFENSLSSEFSRLSQNSVDRSSSKYLVPMEYVVS